MAHELEMVNGQAQMVYAGEVPWHGLGVKVSNDLTPQQMLEAAGLDWTVSPVPLFAEVGDEKLATGHAALIRSNDNRVLDVITDDWNPTQNETAFEFFNDFVAAGDMEMHTAGSLKDGSIVWALAKVNESFELFGGRDKVDSYLHFTNPHVYGKSIDIRMTGTRVVCNNTLTLSLNTKSKNSVRVSHRRKFDGDEVKETMGVAKEKLSRYKEMAEFLSQKRYTNETIVDYFTRVFPVSGSGDKDMSRNADLALNDWLHNQPGSDLGEGTWWQAWNAVTFGTNHIIGRNNDTRLQSLWYGANKNLNQNALELAIDYANS